jgi:hypothetical protein
MPRAVLVLALLGLLQGLTAVNAQGAACVLQFDAPSVETLDSKASQAAVTAGVKQLASNSTIVFRKGYHTEAAILAPVTADLCDTVPSALPPLLAGTALERVAVTTRYEKVSVNARGWNCSYGYSCPWYWVSCRTKTSCKGGRCKNRCYCMNCSG